MRTVTRSYRIRAYPNGAQRRLLDRWFGAARWLTMRKRTAGHEWLAAVPRACLTQALRDQDRAFGNFFAHRAGYPRFKRKPCSGGLRFQGVGVAWGRGIVSLPKLGVLKLTESLPQVRRPDLVTLSRDAAGRYHVSFAAEVDAPLLPIRQRSVGVDVGIIHLATLSTGEKIPNPKRYQARLRYLRQQQRCLARRQKGSGRREKQRLRVARAHAQVKQERQSALHTLTTRLVREFDLICIEDLNVKALCRGRCAPAMRDASFSEIRRQLAYKSEWYGRILESVDRWYPSSKRCSECRHTLDELRLDVREWRCPKCGTWHDRDINAARNVLAEGLRQLAGCDDRDLCVDARGACSEDDFLEQVLAEEARSEYRNRAVLEQTRYR